MAVIKPPGERILTLEIIGSIGWLDVCIARQNLNSLSLKLPSMLDFDNPEEKVKVS